MKTKLILFLLLSLHWLNPLLAQSQGSLGSAPRLLMELAGFEVEDQGRGTFGFYPLDSNGRRATAAQLIQYGFVWDFGNGRYSLAAQPTLAFDEDGLYNVALRVTGFKTIKDPDKRLGAPLPYVSNCQVTETFLKPVPVMGSKGEKGSDRPAAWLEAPPFDPVPDNCITYLLALDLTDAEAYQCDVDLTVEAPGAKGLSDNAMVIDSIESLTPLTILRRNSSAVTISIPEPSRALYGGQAAVDGRTVVNALVHCHIAANATLGRQVKVKGLAKFRSSKRKYPNVNVPFEVEQTLTGSLDPSRLQVVSSPLTTKGAKVTWKLLIENDGPTPESNIDVLGTLSPDFSLRSLKTKQVNWIGKRTHRFKFEKHGEGRSFAWHFRQSPKKALQGNATAEVLIQAKVVKRLHVRRKDPFATVPMPLQVNVHFEHARADYPVRSNPDVRLMGQPKAGKAPIIAVSIAAVLAAAATAYYFFFH